MAHICLHCWRLDWDWQSLEFDLCFSFFFLRQLLYTLTHTHKLELGKFVFTCNVTLTNLGTEGRVTVLAITEATATHSFALMVAVCM